MMAKAKHKNPNKVLLMVDTTAEAALAFQQHAKAQGLTMSELFAKLIKENKMDN